MKDYVGEEIEGQNGRYRLVEEVGRGGFGVTFRAERVENGEVVAVKQLRFDRIEDWKAVELFEREANVLASLDHASIPSYVDNFVLDADSEEPTRFVLVQQFVEGTPLDELSRGGRTLGDDQMVAWFRQILGVCRYLHELNPPVIHRDVAPGNIILADSDEAFLIDFGTVQAKVATEGHIGSTAAGTFGFAAMEQFVGRAVPASDLYGLAMTFLAVRSGLTPEEMPFSGNRVDVSGTLKGAPVHARLAVLLEEMTEPDPRSRPQSAAEVLERLDGVVGRAPGDAPESSELKDEVAEGLGRQLEDVAQAGRRWLDARERAIALTGETLWEPPLDVASMEPEEGSEYVSDQLATVFSDDGRWMVFADNRGTFAVSLDTLEGQCLVRPDGFEASMVGVNRDGTVAVSVGTLSGRMSVFRRARSATNFEEIATHSPGITPGQQPVAVDPAGELAVVATTSQEPAVVIDLADGNIVRRLSREYYESSRFSPDGKWLVCKHYDDFALYSEDGEDLELDVVAFAIREDGRLVARSDGDVISLGPDVQTVGSDTLEPEGGTVSALRFSPRGRLLIALVQLDDDEGGAELQVFDVEKRRSIDVATTPYGPLDDSPSFCISGDGGRVFFQATSRATIFGGAPVPGVFVHSLVRGRPLGTIVSVRNEMHDYRPFSAPLMIGADGFHAFPDGLDASDGFRVEPWHSPELAAAELLDVDASTLLDDGDREKFLEYRTRHRFFCDLVILEMVRPGPGLRDAVGAAAGLGYLCPVAYPMAVAAGGSQRFGAGPIQGATHDALVGAFEELRGQSQAERDERLHGAIGNARSVEKEDAERAATAEQAPPKLSESTSLAPTPGAEVDSPREIGGVPAKRNSGGSRLAVALIGLTFALVVLGGVLWIFLGDALLILLL